MVSPLSKLNHNEELEFLNQELEFLNQEHEICDVKHIILPKNESYYRSVKIL